MKILMGLILFLFGLLTSCHPSATTFSPLSYDQVPVFQFSSTNFWYQKIASNAELDPNSQAMIDLLVKTKEQSTPYALVDDGGVAVFYTGTKTPRYNVPLFSSGNAEHGILSVPIPDFALPDKGSDSHTVFIDTVNNRSYEFWQLRMLGGRWVVGNSAIFSLSGNGVIPFISARASGFSLLAGLIWPQELLAAAIPHALVFVFHPKKGGPVAPATYSDGRYTDPNCLPMGARIQLDPSFDLSTLGIDERRKAIFRALQEYGAYLCDSGSFAFKCVSPPSYNNNPYTGVSGYKQENGSIDLSMLPANKLRVLKLGAVQATTNGRSFPELYY